MIVLNDAKQAVLLRKEAAEALGITPGRVSQLRREGRIPTISTPYGHLFCVRDVEIFRSQRESHLRDRAQVGEKAIASR